MTPSFNSCPREGAIIFAAGQTVDVEVSTHAPARGQSRSIPTPTAAAGSFNSCPREGAIFVFERIFALRVFVSTHAPARGQSIRPQKERNY